MANNCYNHVIISGNRSALQVIEKRFKKYEEFTSFTDFGDFVVNKKRDDGKDANKKPFDFYYEYGTKWWDFFIESDGGDLIITGDSAWSPPLQLLKEISKKYQTRITIEYQEYGMNFGGRAEWDDGNTIEDFECSAQRMDLENMSLEEFYNNQIQWISNDETFEDFMNTLSHDAVDYIGENGVKKMKEWFKEDRNG